MDGNPDFRDLLRAFNEEKAKYLIVGTNRIKRGQPENFQRVGHSVVVLLFGLLGGLAGAIFYGRKDLPERKLVG